MVKYAGMYAIYNHSHLDVMLLVWGVIPSCCCSKFDGILRFVIYDSFNKMFIKNLSQYRYNDFICLIYIWLGILIWIISPGYQFFVFIHYFIYNKFVWFILCVITMLYCFFFSNLFPQNTYKLLIGSSTKRQLPLWRQRAYFMITQMS